MINVEKNEIEICGDAEELGTDLLLANMVVYKKIREFAPRKNAVGTLRELLETAIRKVENGGLLYEEGKE